MKTETEAVQHVHSWTTKVVKGRLRLRTSGMRSIQIVEGPKKWSVWRLWITREHRFGIWEKQGMTETLIEALDLANRFRNEECNPLGICNSYWHIEVHSCFSACPQCGKDNFIDKDLEERYKAPRVNRKTDAIVPRPLRC